MVYDTRTKCELIASTLFRDKNEADKFEYECKIVDKLDCQKMTEKKGVFDFISKIYSYYSLGNDLINCIKTKIPESTSNENDNGLIKKAAELTFGIAMGFVRAAANFSTCGIWGLIKSTYYILKFVYDLYKLASEYINDPAFKLGQLFGKGIMIVKSMVFGRKRKIIK